MYLDPILSLKMHFTIPIGHLTFTIRGARRSQHTEPPDEKNDGRDNSKQRMSLQMRPGQSLNVEVLYVLAVTRMRSWRAPKSVA
jgi:hypothetical protein